MIFDGSLESLRIIRKEFPSAHIHACQTRTESGAYVFDELYGAPVLVLEDRNVQPGRVFEVGMEVI